MTAIDIVVLLISLLVIFATLANFIRLDDWWIRLFDFPRQQLVCVGLPALLIAGAQLDSFFSWPALVVLLLILSLSYQIQQILPFTRFYPKQVSDLEKPDSSRQISLLVSNVLTPNRQSTLLLEQIQRHQPDIVLTLESDLWWQEQLSALNQKYPYCVRVPLDNLYGMHLYSKLELTESRIHYLVHEDIPSIHTRVRLRSGQWLRLYCLHPTPPIPPENDSSEERDAELLLVATKISQRNESTIVVGDLNDVAWSRTTMLFQRISCLLDPRRGRGFYSTFHAQCWFLRWPLDHVFHSSDFVLASIRRLADIGSDHFPIYVTLQLTPEQDTDAELEADTEDRRSAAEKIDKVETRGSQLQPENFL